MEEVTLLESILQSIKKLLGIQSEYDAFDPDIIIHINTMFAVLNQLNIGPKDGFLIESTEETWDQYITKTNLTMIKSFIYLKVKLIFDPPSSTAVIESINRTIGEIEFRLYVEGDPARISEGGDMDE